ncbi:MAG TPA: hypothetical protein VNR00_14680 [Opitutus sp.]|nr:hypothetical protein [Opitutus sp.]
MSLRPSHDSFVFTASTDARDFVIASNAKVTQRSDFIPAHVLIVDEDPLSCAGLGRLVAQSGHSIALACSLAVADAMRLSLTFDLVLVDLSRPSPDLDRWVACLVADPRGATIALVGNEPARAAADGIDFSDTFHLAKPVDPAALRALLARFGAEQDLPSI